MCNSQPKSPEEVANEEPLIDSLPNPDYIEPINCVGTHTGDDLQDIINS